jgi:hypothetical protein
MEEAMPTPKGTRYFVVTRGGKRIRIAQDPQGNTIEHKVLPKKKKKAKKS